MRLIVVTLTYNRTALLERLLAQVREQAPNVTHLVFDDCTPEPAWNAKRDVLQRANVEWWRQPERCARAGHWRLVTAALQEVARRPYDRLVFVPDDAILCGDFFDRAEKLWSETLEDDGSAITLNTLLEAPRMWGPCWTNYVPKPAANADVMRTQWIDGFIYTDNRFTDKVRAIRPTQYYPNRGSGVWAQVSRNLHAAGASLYQVTESLIDLASTASEMRPGTEGRIVVGFRP